MTVVLMIGQLCSIKYSKIILKLKISGDCYHGIEIKKCILIYFGKQSTSGTNGPNKVGVFSRSTDHVGRIVQRAVQAESGCSGDTKYDMVHITFCVSNKNIVPHEFSINVMWGHSGKASYFSLKVALPEIPDPQSTPSMKIKLPVDSVSA